LINTIEWIDKKVKIIDQTKLPDGLEYIYCQDVNTLREEEKRDNRANFLLF